MEGEGMIPAQAVEAAADLIIQVDMGGCECRRSPYDKHDVNPPCSTRRRAIRIARAALEAADPHMRRTITTAEELDALPEGTQIVDQREWLTLEETSIQCLEWVDQHGNACHVELPAIILDPQP